MIKNLYVNNKSCSVSFRKNNSIPILNIGAGKIDPLDLKNFKNYFLVNLDKNYMIGAQPQVTNVFEDLDYVDSRHETMQDNIDSYYDEWLSCKSEWRRVIRSNLDVYDFLSRISFKFDLITMYRFLEHVPFDKILYFIYLLSTAINKDGLLDIIVPDYKKLAEMILDEDPLIDGNFDVNNIILTTELLNEPNDPHASIWTESRIWYYFQYENRFEVENIQRHFDFDGRDIYIRASIRRT